MANENEGNSLITQTTGTSPPTSSPPTNPPAAFTPDPAKTEAENAAAKAEFDKANPPQKEQTAEEKAASEAALKDKVTTENPYKVEELKLPEGFTVDEATSKSFVDIVNKYGLPRSAATDLVKLQGDFIKAASEKGDKLWTDLQDTWRKEAETDPDIGGSKLAPSLGAIAKVVDKYGSPELRQALDLTGAGNNPHVIKFLYKISQELTEPGPRLSPSPSGGPRSAAEIMFPDQGKAA